MIIANGLQDNCVLQRNQNDLCEITISGYIASKEAPNIQVLGLPKNFDLDIIQLKNYKTSPSSSTLAYSFEATLYGIPVGGPYSISFSECEQTFQNILVGDVYILAGQSNMQGIGRLQKKPSLHPYVRGFYMDNHWDIALDPLHVLTSSPEPIHAIIAGGTLEPENEAIGVGPGIEFAINLYEMTGVPQGIIASAHGGTTMSQWSPTYEDNSEDSLYKATLRRVQKTGNHVKGLFWYQGCSDTDEQATPKYTERTIALFDAFRRDLQFPDLPIVAVQLSRVSFPMFDATYWNSVQMQQYELGLHYKNLNVVPSIDLDMDDFIHISSRSSGRLGRRCASAMYQLLEPQSQELPPIQLKKVEVITDKENWNGKVYLTFDHVNGSLHSKDRAAGFTLSKSPDKEDGNYIIYTECNGNQIILHTTEIELDLTNMYLHYGSGFQPYCNITDDKDHALPVIKNIPLGTKRFFSQAPMKCWITDPFYEDSLSSIEKAAIEVDFPLNSTSELKEALNNDFEFRNFYYFYLNTFSKFDFNKGSYGKISYILPFEAKDDMNVSLLYGSMSELQIFCDCHLISVTDLSDDVLKPDMYEAPMFLSKGLHFLQVNLIASANYKPGLFIRFEQRTADADGSVKLPTWIEN